MTNPDHYHEAVRTLAMVGDLSHGDPMGPELLAEAQVHATLHVGQQLAALVEHLTNPVRTVAPPVPAAPEPPAQAHYAYGEDDHSDADYTE